ncbi:MAG: 4Fe-4S binding protein [Candidatus Omnitrophota bacterium]
MPRITIDRDACKGCGLCSINCPEKLIVIDETLNVRGVHPAKFIGQEDPDKCKGCKMCAIMCPEVCIEVFK